MKARIEFSSNMQFQINILSGWDFMCLSNFPDNVLAFSAPPPQEKNFIIIHHHSQEYYVSK